MCEGLGETGGCNDKVKYLTLANYTGSLVTLCSHTFHMCWKQDFCSFQLHDVEQYNMYTYCKHPCVCVCVCMRARTASKLQQQEIRPQIRIYHFLLLFVSLPLSSPQHFKFPQTTTINPPTMIFPSLQITFIKVAHFRTVITFYDILALRFPCPEFPYCSHRGQISSFFFHSALK